MSLTTLRERLSAAGLQVSSSGCGTDGRVYPTVCGAPDGRIGIFEIALDASAQPPTLPAGFDLLSQRPGAVRVACP
ncbi:MAG: hypothetical protein ACKOCJ_01940 [Burkholderiaceae bacterium]